MNRAELQFRSFLTARKLKYTPERRRILEEVFASDTFFDAEQLLSRLKKHNKQVSRATVYRTLDLMAKLGLVQRVCLGEKSSFYENSAENQHRGRVVCLECGKIEHFDTTEIDRLIDQACFERNFVAQSRCVQMAGYCRHCEKKHLNGKNANCEE